VLVGWALTTGPVLAQNVVKGQVSATAENGFARLVFHLAEDVESQVRVSNNILTVTFLKPVDVSVERINASVPSYISAARRDPDGKAVRFALARKVKVNSTPAGEQLFVDLLPDGWAGLAPPLPRDVIEELARRARTAEKVMREQRMLARQSRMAPIKVRTIVQPTFTRYVFDLPELIGVSADNAKDKLTLIFDAELRFDLADAQATRPPAISNIETQTDQDSAKVRFTFGSKVDVRTFREDNSYVVDVSTAGGKAARRADTVRSDQLTELAGKLGERDQPPPGLEPPKTVPAEPAPTDQPARNSVPAKASAPIMPARFGGPQESSIAAHPGDGHPIAQSAPQPAPDATRPAGPRAGSTMPSQADLPKPEPAAAEKSAPRSEIVLAERSAAPPGVAADSHHAAAAGSNSNGKVQLRLKRDGEALTLQFPFASPTPAAVFQRGDALWLIFDSPAELSIAALDAEIGHGIKSARLTRERGFLELRIKPERPQLVSVTGDSRVWTVTLGSEMAEPSQPLVLNRNIVGAARASVTIAFDDPRELHRLTDPDAGDMLLVVTALAPARGILKSQDFVEFRLPATSQGLVIQPLADDVNAELSTDKIIISRPNGLTLSAAAHSDHGTVYRRQALDTQSWGFDRQAPFADRKSQLIRAAAEAPDSKRMMARTDLARFYLARDMAAEAKAVLDVALADGRVTADDPTPLVLHAVANIMIGRGEAALKDLANPSVGNQNDAPLWRALAYASMGRWAQARAGFRNTEAAISTMPLEMQRVMLKEMIRTFVEVGDITGAVNEMHEFETVGIPHEFAPAISVLSGRIAEGLGRLHDARRAYQAAADSWDRPAAAEGELRDILLQHSIGVLNREEAVSKLETLTIVWRGDDTEIGALQLLARLYTEEGRYRDAFSIMRTAVRLHPDSELTRRIQDDAAATFDSLFLAGKGDALAAVDALALFYDFRELTPIGRRGDEMIRRLADRLVSIDLLDQASELLQYQVDHRLQGAARAQVAARLAVIYLMNRKPDRALATLNATRVSSLSDALRDQRLLLEARALSDTGRHEVALEVAANLTGPEAIRLRSDILWAAKRYDEAAEQIELLYGDRWKGFEPLADSERMDILRAAIGYVLGEDTIGVMRFREKYAAKMGDGPDRRAFEVVTAPIAPSGAEFGAIARSIATADTLEAFLRDLRTRYPETGALPSTQPPKEKMSPVDARSTEPTRTGGALSQPSAPSVPPAHTASSH
jgi:tetratricopeptide (TPR) repeat protein